MYRPAQYSVIPPPHVAYLPSLGIPTTALHSTSLATRVFVPQTPRNAPQTPLVTVSSTQPSHISSPTLASNTGAHASSVRSLRASVQSVPLDPSLVTMSAAAIPRTVAVPKIPTASYPVYSPTAPVQPIPPVSMPTLVSAPICYTYTAPIQRDLHPTTPRVSVPRQFSHMRVAPQHIVQTPRGLQTTTIAPQHAFTYHPLIVSHTSSPTTVSAATSTTATTTAALHPIMNTATVNPSQLTTLAYGQNVQVQGMVPMDSTRKPQQHSASGKSVVQQHTQTEDVVAGDLDVPFDASTQTDESYDDSEAGLIDDEELVDYEDANNPGGKQERQNHELVVEIKADEDDMNWNPLASPVLDRKGSGSSDAEGQDNRATETSIPYTLAHHHFDTFLDYRLDNAEQTSREKTFYPEQQNPLGDASITDILKQAQMHREKELLRRKRDEQSLTELRQWNTNHSLPNNHITNARS